MAIRYGLGAAATPDDFGGASGYDWNYYGYDAVGNTDASLGMPGAQNQSLYPVAAPMSAKAFFEANKTVIYIAAGAFLLFSMFGGHRR